MWSHFLLLTGIIFLRMDSLSDRLLKPITVLEHVNSIEAVTKSILTLMTDSANLKNNFSAMSIFWTT
jgi:hypothetical protein